MKKLFLYLFTGSMMVACGDKDKDTDPVFNKTPLMTNVADNYVIPAFNGLDTSVNQLVAADISFQNNPGSTEFSALTDAYIQVTLQFERVRMLDFGPSMTAGLNAGFGVFPADTAQIETNITAGTYNLLTVDNVSAIGLDALDYLLFRPNALSILQSSASARTYVHDLIVKMDGEANAVAAAWNGSYRSTFINGTGTSSTAPFALLVNAFCKDFEVCKNAKVGIPIGKQSLDIAQPHYFQAKWSGMSQQLLSKNLTALKELFNGGSGQGFDDYLQALEKATLVSTIQNRMNYLIAESESWNTSLPTVLTNNGTTLSSYYDYMQGTVVYFKTDMTSAFGVLITYQDNDGD